MFPKTSPLEPYFIFFAISHALNEASVLYYYRHTLTPRFSKIHPVLQNLPFLLIPVCYKVVTGEVHSPTHIFFLYGSMFLACIILYKETVMQRIGNFFFGVAYSLLAENILVYIYCIGILELCFGIPFIPNTLSSTHDIQKLCLTGIPFVIIQFLLTPLAIIVWKKYLCKINLKLIIQFGLLTFISFSGVPYIFPDLFGRVGWFLAFLCLLLSIVVFFLGIINLQKLFRKSYLQEKEQKLLKQHLTDFKKQQEESLQLRKQHHDLTGHMQAVSYLISEGKTEEALTYIEELKQEINTPPTEHQKNSQSK